MTPYQILSRDAEGTRRRTARAYIRRIRNLQKLAYAVRVYAALVRGWDVDRIPPDCSYMAAQAVRMRLREILDLPGQQVKERTS